MYCTLQQFVVLYIVKFVQDTNKDIQRKANLLVRDIDDVKQGLSLLQVWCFQDSVYVAL